MNGYYFPASYKTTCTSNLCLTVAKRDRTHTRFSFLSFFFNTPNSSLTLSIFFFNFFSLVSCVSHWTMTGMNTSNTLLYFSKFVNLTPVLVAMIRHFGIHFKLKLDGSILHFKDLKLLTSK